MRNLQLYSTTAWSFSCIVKCVGFKILQWPKMGFSVLLEFDTKEIPGIFRMSWLSLFENNFYMIVTDHPARIKHRKLALNLAALCRQNRLRRSATTQILLGKSR